MQVTVIGVDLAKNVFQVHGAAPDGTAVLRKKLSRSQFRDFMARQPSCIVAMEACATAHYWAREMIKMGHDARLIAPIYVKPFVKRQKNDSADAEAIAEAALRPTMRFVHIKSTRTQSWSMLFRTCEQLIGQRTEVINALRGHLAEFGHIAPKGRAHLSRLLEAIEDRESDLPALVRELAKLHLQRIDELSALIDQMTQKIKDLGKESAVIRLLRSMPGIGPISAMAIEAFAPELSRFERGRDFAAWLGLTPRQHSTGGKQRLGRVSKMGQRDIRRLLIIGAMSRIASTQRYQRAAGPWLQDKLSRKPKMVAAIALANKMARQIWAMLSRGEAYKMPVSVWV